MLKSLTLILLTVFISFSLVPVPYSGAVATGSGSVDPKLSELLERFARTEAIGVFTKLSVKNNVTRLNQSFGLYHQGKRPPTVDELQESYDLMVQEIIVLVQNKDPELARDFYAARELLWSYLSDPEKYVLFKEI